jgi:hypothetical protein
MLQRARHFPQKGLLVEHREAQEGSNREAKRLGVDGDSAAMSTCAAEAKK